eukprot:9377095-Karenia_brevis.AAC.1
MLYGYDCEIGERSFTGDAINLSAEMDRVRAGGNSDPGSGLERLDESSSWAAANSGTRLPPLD